MKKIFFFLILFLSLPTVFCQQISGPFTPKSEGGAVWGGIQYQSFSKVQLANDSLRTRQNNLRAVTDITFPINAIFGASDKVALFISVPIRIVSTSSAVNSNADSALVGMDTLATGSIVGFGNVLVGAKYKFLDKNGWMMAASITGELKTGKYDQRTGIRTGTDAWGFRPMLHFGKSWKWKYYLQSDIGGTYRTDNHSGDFRFHLEGGAFLLKSIWLRGGLDVTRSFYNGTFERKTDPQYYLYANNQEWVALHAQAEYQHSSGFGIYAGIKGFFAGNNIPTTPLFYGGIFFRWKFDIAPKENFKIIDMPAPTN